MFRRRIGGVVVVVEDGKILKNAYSSFIPPDLTVMVVSWANKNLFE
jgi:hypothetical protein